VLAEPEHELHDEAVKLRVEISGRWHERAVGGMWFPWPTTEAPRGIGRLYAAGWREHGMLGYLGYHVGATQPTPRNIRRQILEYVVECHLPPLNDQIYHAEWAEPLSPQRLKKLANTLAALARHAKRREEGSWGSAINDWETDLALLRERYYVRVFQFGWPTTVLWH